jgi:LCP family protein required for cell wall assembly
MRPQKSTSTVSKRPKKSLSQRCTALFLKAFFISFSSLSLIVIAIGVLMFLNTVEPPEIPIIPPVVTGITINDPNDSGLEDNKTDITIEPVAPERFTNDDRRGLYYTFLIIGLNEGTNANVVMVASYDGVSKEANLVSIPRDSLINVNRRNKKLSGAYLNGAHYGGGVEAGVAQTQREVMSVVGFVPDFHIVIDYDVFYGVIDAIGGIEIDVPFHMKYDDPWQNLHIDIEPGLQQMDGKTALHFVRYRNSNRGYQAITDYQRIENQQTVIYAIIGNLMRFENIVKIPEFIELFNENVHTNLTMGNLLWFAKEFNDLRGTDALSNHTAPTTGSSGRPMWYELLDAPGIVELVNQTINPFNRDIELRDLDIISTY